MKTPFYFDMDKSIINSINFDYSININNSLKTPFHLDMDEIINNCVAGMGLAMSCQKKGNPNNKPMFKLSDFLRCVSLFLNIVYDNIRQ